MTTGRYLLEEADVSPPGSGFEIKRRYVSGDGITGSFGTGWSGSVDNQIMRGATRIDEEAIEEANRSGETVNMHARTLADEIRSHPSYNERDIIILMSCSTGGTPLYSRDSAFAQVLADALGPDTVVKAPESDYFMEGPDGKFYLEGAIINGRFIPGGEPQYNYDNLKTFIGRCND